MTKTNEKRLLGVVSDTHGLVRPELLKGFAGCDLILHAGDVDRPEVLERLEEIAPVRAVRGNMDKGEWAARLPETEVIEAGAQTIYMLHDIGQLDLDPAAAGFQVLLYGHSHRPALERRDGVLYLNPGSAGPRRFRLPVSAALLEVSDEGLQVRQMTLIP